ncbi:hypothetical protein VNI00_008024 [Paramarasmius palmivorus]|uniref:HD domain-containing protein n=1 Tax=Paramarasmius palmivorus TaxID=297713 RepID=A0AAW0CYJ5_9AGAR
MEPASSNEDPFWHREEETVDSEEYNFDVETVQNPITQRQLKDPIHDLSVAHLARKLVENLRRAQPDLDITDRDIECVEIAGLCHDLGHGPWSHAFDGLFIPEMIPDTTWTHEQGSEMMLDYLIEDNNINIAEADVNFIKDLIIGERRRCSQYEAFKNLPSSILIVPLNRDEKAFLFEIVANKRNGLDVDKFDYIQRDSHLLGDPTKINVNRILQSARVIDGEICYHIKDLPQIKEIYRTRFKLHELYYNHKTAKIIEYMILDALRSADKFLGISDRIRDPERFCLLTDNIMHEIKISKNPELAEAREIFHRIEKRQLYKVVEWKLVKYQYRKTVEQAITASRIVEAAKAAYSSNVSPDLDISQLKDADVIVEFSTLHHGMKERNPVDFVKFYSKMNPNKSRHAQPGEYSTVMPSTFAEVLMRVYTKKPEFLYLVQAGYRAVLESFRQAQSPPAMTPGIATPPTTEPATSPQTMSIDNETAFSSKAVPLPTPGGNKRTNSITNTFSANEFTTVTPGYGMPSPSSTRRRTSSSAKKRGLPGLRDRSTSPSDGRRKSTVVSGSLLLPTEDDANLAEDRVDPPVKKRKVGDVESGLLEAVCLDEDVASTSGAVHATSATASGEHGSSSSG